MQNPSEGTVTMSITKGGLHQTNVYQQISFNYRNSITRVSCHLSRKFSISHDVKRGKTKLDHFLCDTVRHTCTTERKEHMCDVEARQ